MPSPSNDRWTVLGAGAIGCLFAHYLHRSGCPVTLLHRTGKNIGRIDLVLDGARHSLQLPQTTVVDCEPVSHLLVTTKAGDVCDAVHGIAGKLLPDAPVLILVNGMGLREAILADHPDMQVYCATTTQGAHKVSAGRIRHAGMGATIVGANAIDRPPSWFTSWQRGVQDCHWDAQIEGALWHKLAINCAINPLTAVHQCRNGELAQRPELSAEVAELCREISQVSYAAGYTTTAQTIEQSAMQVIHATASNQSSMLQDVAAGRQTEIDYITGYLLSVAATHGIPAPRNTTLFEKVKSLEQSTP